MHYIKNDDVSIVLCGQAGQGIQTIEHIITRVLKLSGYNVFATREYMSRIRGGTNSTEIRVSSKRIGAFIDRIDILIPISKGAIKHLNNRISNKTVILGEKGVESDLDHDYEIINIPFTKISLDIGSPIFSNTVAAGVISSIFKVESKILFNYINNFFSVKGRSAVEKNVESAKRGYDIGRKLIDSGKIEVNVMRNHRIKDELILSGGQAVALGAIAGGCNFLSFYPMSPSTGIAAFLAQQSNLIDIIVEQAEDEISAINMAIGAWYAGARGLVVTSGGGFDLMAEGISLAGILETPIVVHIGQRPGPATGLPTRTEQGDIEIALYSGHGEFPRIIFTPGTLEEVFSLTQRAFNLADKYQVPVFILTDQYLIDSYYNIPRIDLSNIQIESHISETDSDYKRYKLTGNGISPRGIPGFGKGLVCLDSDEHDEEGHITEDFDMRTKMVQKRQMKMELVKKEALPPQLVGNKNYEALIIGWGSTYNVIREALADLNREDVAFLHFKQVYPLHQNTKGYIEKAKKTVIIENNYTSQFGKLITLGTGIEVRSRILKYSGLPFSVEEIVGRLKGFLL